MVMSGPKIIPVPKCPRCYERMVWWSIENIAWSGREERMNIFKCEKCERFTAAREPMSPTRAA